MPTITRLLRNQHSHGGAAAAAAASTSCAKEFENCVTNRDCCGFSKRGNHDDRKAIECVTGDWAHTTDSTCISKRSQMLDSITKDHDFTVDDVTVLLLHFIYKMPEIEEKQKGEKQEDYYYYKIAQKYRHDFAKLIVNLERKYGIKDSTAIPKLIRDYLSFRDQINITKMFMEDDDDEDESSGEEESSKEDTVKEL